MSDRPEGYEGLPDIVKAVFELRRINDSLETILDLIQRAEPDADPIEESEVLEPAPAPKRRRLFARLRRK